ATSPASTTARACRNHRGSRRAHRKPHRHRRDGGPAQRKPESVGSWQLLRFGVTEEYRRTLEERTDGSLDRRGGRRLAEPSGDVAQELVAALERQRTGGALDQLEPSIGEGERRTRHAPPFAFAVSRASHGALPGAWPYLRSSSALWRCPGVSSASASGT